VKWIDQALAHPLSGAKFQAGVKNTYVVAGGISLALAAFSLTLPHTPPKKKEEGAAESLAWLEATKLLKHPFVLVLWVVTFVDSFVHNSYFNWTGTFLGTRPEAGGVGIAGNWIMPVMTIGQIAEILTMFILGATLKKLGWRMTMILGILGHAARFAVYAFFPEPKELIVAVQVLHGICYAFFFATVYIFVDEYFPKDVRASAQGLFNVMILGIGALAANSICPVLLQKIFTANGVTDFRGLFLVPLSAATGAALALALFFRPPAKTEPALVGVAAPAH
jgi:MFS family permease